MILTALVLAATITVKADVPRMSAAELHAAIQKGDAVAVDVRGSVPYKYGHIAGAVWLPLGLMSQRAGELPEDKLVVTYCTCKAEETSLEGAMLLSSLGFPRVAVLQGGYPAWKEAGLPVDATVEVEVTNGGRGSAGRYAPPPAIACDRNDLTSYAGTIRQYRRAKDKTTVVIATSADTVERLNVHHSGTDDPSRHFLIEGVPVTPGDWNRIERKKGELHPDMGVIAWVCADGKVILDFRPGTQFTGAE